MMSFIDSKSVTSLLIFVYFVSDTYLVIKTHPILIEILCKISCEAFNNPIEDRHRLYPIIEVRNIIHNSPIVERIFEIGD